GARESRGGDAGECLSRLGGGPRNGAFLRTAAKHRSGVLEVPDVTPREIAPASSAPREYAELAELAGSFIHEIKNHLGTLGLNLQLLAEDFQDPQNQRERRALERMHRLQSECQRLVEVSNDFLRFARIEELNLQPTALNEVVEELLEFFEPTARQASIDIKCYLPADLPRVPLDRELFKQALLNLLLNAQQAMPGGGQVTIQAKPIAVSGVAEPK